MAGTPRSWSDIPVDLAGLVLGRLPSHVDRVRFAAVCPQWRSAARQVRLAPPPPLLALKRGGTFYSMPRGEPLRFPGCDEGFATASGSWLVYRRTSSVVLVDPFTGATMTLPDPADVHLPFKGDDSEYGYEYANDVGDDSTDESDGISRSLKCFKVIKLIVCSPNLIAALFSSSTNYIAVCRPGGSFWSVAWDLPLWITDMAFYQEKLYALNYREALLALDITVDDNADPQVAWIGQAIKVNSFDNRTFKRMLYLVESRGKLLLVRRMIPIEQAHGRGQIQTFDGQCEPDVAIFEADFEQSRWVEVTSLGDDQVLFLGQCSRAVRILKLDSPSNRVWFLDDYKDFNTCACDKCQRSSTSGTSGTANHRKPFSPLPMISWGGWGVHLMRAGAAWLFPLN